MHRTDRPSDQELDDRNLRGMIFMSHQSTRSSNGYPKSSAHEVPSPLRLVEAT